MPLLAATNLAHAFGERVILSGCSISVEPGERIGIVGRNGAGKSTLLKSLAGVFTCDAGEVVLQRGCRTGYLRQDPQLDPTTTLFGAAESAFAELHALHDRLNALFDEMAGAGDDPARLESLMKQQAELEERMLAAGGYVVEHKIGEVLHGLGFTDSQFSIPVPGLSGGQKARLSLAKLLLESPDILLLDEPTNHLDIDGRIWLENFLRDQFKGAVLLISHDRALLDKVVSRIVEVEAGRLIDYPGNYHAFRELRAERRLAMARAWENQQDKFRKEEAFIRRYKAGQRAKQARGRATRLDREKRDYTLERPMEFDELTIELPAAPRSGDIVVSCRGLSKSYPADDGTRKVLFKDLDLSIQRGERWGIIGPNGAGKTTLVRTLLGDLEPDAGQPRTGSNLRVGYYRQTHEGVDLDQPVYRYLQGVILKEAPDQAFSEQKARDLAGAFLFSGPEQDRMMRDCSGGERSRAIIAGLLASAKNVLVLDEPTNHLDLSASERLEQALLDPEDGGTFDGTLLLISHDRELIDNTCDHLLALDGQGNAEVFLGTYSEWAQKRARAEAERRREEAEALRRKEEAERRKREPEPQKPKPAKNASANGLARLSMDQLEQKIEKIDRRTREIDALLNDPDVWRDHARANALGDERAKLAAELEPLEFEWSRRAEEQG